MSENSTKLSKTEGSHPERGEDLPFFKAALDQKAEREFKSATSVHPTANNLFARRSRWKPIRERIVTTLLFSCAGVSVLTTAAIVVILSFESLSFFKTVTLGQFLLDTSWTPLFSDNPHFGIWPLVSGTVLTSLIALSVSVPSGVIIAIYLSQFSTPRVRSILKPFLEILAGIPTVVYGYFALIVVTPVLKHVIPSLGTFNALSPGLVMGIMILPMVASLSEDALYSVPRALREGAYALGANRLQMIFGVLLPSAFGGISASFILAMSRAIGETMIVAIAAGQQPSLSVNPLQPLQTMTAYIVQISLGDTPHGTIEFQTIFAVAGVLFLMTIGLNILSLKLRSRYEESAR